MALLEVKNLCKSFGGLAAVKNVSVSVPKGNIVSLIGPNGAGKTTVFNLLTGFYTRDNGNVILDGEALGNLSAHEYVKKGLSRTFQNLRLFSKMTAAENVLVGYQSKVHYNNFDAVFYTKRFRNSEKQAREQARAALEKLKLTEYENELSSGLPYGLQKRLEIARAIVSSPKILLLDEPAAGLNPNETEDLCQLILSLSKEGNTVFLIEHDMKLVMKISDYVYVMDHGEMLSEGIPEVVRKDQKVIEAYFGKGGTGNAAKRE